MNDEYTKMAPAGTLHAQLAAGGHNAGTEAAVGTDKEQKGTSSGQQQDPENRYVIVN
jgi:hypothetical protein